MTIKESIKRAFNTRIDEKTGRSYVKGEKSHKGEALGSMHEMEYISDPNLKEDKEEKKKKGVEMEVEGHNRHKEYR